MKYRIEKLGRVRSAEISLKPFTIFIGKNDSGKSYAASGLWAIINFLIKSAPRRCGDNVLKLKGFVESLEREVSPAEFRISFSEDEVVGIKDLVEETFQRHKKRVLAEAIGYDGFGARVRTH